MSKIVWDAENGWHDGPEVTVGLDESGRLTVAYVVTVTPAVGTDPEAWDGSGAYVLACTCGEKVTYSGKAFTQVEASRHQKYHAKAGKR